MNFSQRGYYHVNDLPFKFDHKNSANYFYHEQMEFFSSINQFWVNVCDAQIQNETNHQNYNKIVNTMTSTPDFILFCLNNIHSHSLKLWLNNY